MKNDSLTYKIQLIEWVALMGYKQAVGGNWVDEKQNTVAKDTEELIQQFDNRNLTFEVTEESVSEYGIEVESLLKETDVDLPSSLCAGAVRHRKPLKPDTFIERRLYKDTRCVACQDKLLAGTSHYTKPGYRICTTCYYQWIEEACDLRNFSVYRKWHGKEI